MEQICAGFYFYSKKGSECLMSKRGKRTVMEQWEEDGRLEEVMEFIKECSRKLITQAEMCEHLKINEATFSRMKKKHPEIQKIQNEALLDLKKDLAGALYKKAVGFELIEETQDIEDGGKGQKQKRKIHRVKKQVAPDYKSIIYLLSKTFGREYSERYEELQMMERKLEQAKEEWNKNGNNTDENSPDEDSRD
ncbi:hypothetical protein LJC17_02920 [Acholeplasma sp. OttesenSCG-928-E16]|nr:hypothetical protein [Acholeplasma sp. OttesenSCG-928-E16]